MFLLILKAEYGTLLAKAEESNGVLGQVLIGLSTFGHFGLLATMSRLSGTWQQMIGWSSAAKDEMISWQIH